jgi:GNAT superfamily N-acetyltransferase
MLIEELSLSAWPALQTEVYDGWLLRFAEGYTKRSNSVNPLYASTIALEEKVEHCERTYRGRGLPTIFKLLDTEAHKGIDEKLATKGYERLDETSVRVLDLRSLYEISSSSSISSIEIGEAFDGEWLDGLCACNLKAQIRGTVERVLGNLLSPAIVVKARIDGRIVGCGYGAVERGYVGVFDIIVEKEMRGRGLGEGIVRAILERARSMGTLRAYLQVVSGNVPAENLYTKIGFSEAYRYWYRKK